MIKGIGIRSNSPCFSESQSIIFTWGKKKKQTEIIPFQLSISCFAGISAMFWWRRVAKQPPHSFCLLCFCCKSKAVGGIGTNGDSKELENNASPGDNGSLLCIVGSLLSWQWDAIHVLLPKLSQSLLSADTSEPDNGLLNAGNYSNKEIWKTKQGSGSSIRGSLQGRLSVPSSTKQEPLRWEWICLLGRM